MAIPALLKFLLVGLVGAGGVGLVATGAYYLSRAVEAIFWILMPVLVLFAAAFLLKLYKILRNDFNDFK